MANGSDVEEYVRVSEDEHVSSIDNVSDATLFPIVSSLLVLRVLGNNLKCLPVDENDKWL